MPANSNRTNPNYRPTARELSEDAHAAEIAFEKDPANEALGIAAKKAHMLAALAALAAAHRLVGDDSGFSSHLQAARTHFILAGSGDLMVEFERAKATAHATA